MGLSLKVMKNDFMGWSFFSYKKGLISIATTLSEGTAPGLQLGAPAVTRRKCKHLLFT